jgi:hypothetical protein
MSLKISISLSEWVIRDILNQSTNKSARVEELIIKAYMIEREEKIKRAMYDDNKMVPKARLGLPTSQLFIMENNSFIYDCVHGITTLGV